MAAATARAPTASAAAPSRAVVAAPTPTPTLLLRPRAARLPLLPPPSSIGRSGTSSFKGGSGTSSFSAASSSPAAAPAASTTAAEGIGRSGASAFSGSRGRSGASSFGANDSPSTTSTSWLKSLPTALTIARVLAIPLVVRLWFCSSPAAPLWCAALFAASCFTDWLDGFLARRLDASTPFGAFLDPVADKLTVATTLVLLSTRPPLPPSPLAADLAWLVPLLSAAIINREIAMSALREWAATLGPEARATVAVGSLGKIKTAAQMSAIVLLLWTRDGAASAASVGLSAAAFELAAVVGPPLLMVAAALTKLSLFQYIAALWPWITGKKKAGGGGVVVA